jgi:sterol 3beta-glucosyltransferase
MRVVLATYGTTGDIQPLLALAAALLSRGHTLKFGAPPDFAARIRKLGFDFAPLGPPMDPRELREVYGRASLTGDVVQHVQRTLPLVIRDAPQMIEELSEACIGADALIALPYQLAGRIVHDLQGIPLISVHLSPFGGYSRRFASESARLINELRACYALEALADPLGADGGSSLLALYAVSPELFRRPRHWPKHHHMTGFFFLDEETAPEPRLERFLTGGEKPVVISFGSVLHQAPAQLAAIVSDAIRRAGRRAIVQQGWTSLRLSVPDQDVLLVDVVPHHWLFKRAACVVHAGGAGTTAATLRAGLPCVVVPHVLDQFLWATLIRERGCAADVIPFAELTADRLSRAIRQALDSECRSAAARFAERIASEDGVSTAADLIESHLQSHPSADNAYQISRLLNF